jgi:class 3 adenylate cyclase
VLIWLAIFLRTVISKLRNQETITAELYESVTTLFSDIPVFTRLVTECAPIEVVTFLSQIHSDFDRVVSSFDAYKVETINDSYVVCATEKINLFFLMKILMKISPLFLKVVSGLPLRNDDRHAIEICRLALGLRVAGNSILLPSWGDIGVCPRIGINSGKRLWIVEKK